MSCPFSKSKLVESAVATYQVPMEVRPEREDRPRSALDNPALYSRQRSERTMKERLANEIMDAVEFDRFGIQEA